MTVAAELDRLCIDTLRTLAIDQVQKANSGHSGTPMGAAPAAYCLWQRFMRFDPEDAPASRCSTTACSQDADDARDEASSRAPDAQLDVPGRGKEVVVRSQQHEPVTYTQLSQQCIYGAQLNAFAPTSIADFGRVDVVLAIGLKERKRGEGFQKLRPCLRPGKALQQLLQHQPSSNDLSGPQQRVVEGSYFSGG
jgi:Transketolase, thiamine diphosphate binding domain